MKALPNITIINQIAVSQIKAFADQSLRKLSGSIHIPKSPISTIIRKGTTTIARARSFSGSCMWCVIPSIYHMRINSQEL